MYKLKDKKRFIYYVDNEEVDDTYFENALYKVSLVEAYAKVEKEYDIKIKNKKLYRVFEPIIKDLTLELFTDTINELEYNATHNIEDPYTIRYIDFLIKKTR